MHKEKGCKMESIGKHHATTHENGCVDIARFKVSISSYNGVACSRHASTGSKPSANESRCRSRAKSIL
jgi:hypothetical protein